MAQDKKPNPNPLSLIINDGIVYKKKDMLMLLRDLNKVSYQEIVGGRRVASGTGYLMQLSCNSEDPSLFLNSRVYINVALFNYLKLYKDGERENTVFELHNDDRVMRLIPEDVPCPVFPLEREYNFLPPPPEFLDGGYWGN
jgi:hypothetical protein